MLSARSKKSAAIAEEDRTVAPLSTDDRLLLEVVDALRGADNLSERLLMALQTGTPAVADLAYAVKARVKEDYKVIDKIKDRREGGEGREGRPSYGVADVTDLVGLRIVTLYRLDVIDVIEALLATMDRDASDSAPFVPRSISEVIVYSTNATGDVQGLPAKVMSLFQDYGLGGVARLAERPSNYSSIHILARGRGKYRDGYRELPVEIQVRTALEDVWGQIEHSLKYKRQKMADARPAAGGRLQTTLSHLGALKTMIDGIAQYGDQIKLQIDELEPDLRNSVSKAAEEPWSRLKKLTDLPPELRAEIAAAVRDAGPALSSLSQPAAVRARMLRSGLSRLEAAEVAVARLTGLRRKTVIETRYVLTMQRALLHFQLGNLLDDGAEHLSKAHALYLSMEAEFPARVIVAFRVARTLQSLGATQDALAKMRDVVDRLRTDPVTIPQDHWIRSTAPRSLGVMLWQEARTRMGPDGPPADAKALALLREAVRLTSEAHAVQVADGFVLDGDLPERTRAANNLLYYLLDYLEAGGAPEQGMDEVAVLRHLGEIGGDNPARMTDLPAADTARRAHAHLGRGDLELEAARTVIRLSPQTPSSRSPAGREAVRAAERTVNQRPGAGLREAIEG